MMKFTENPPPSLENRGQLAQNEMTKYERWDIGLHVVEITSMFAVAVIALFGDSIRRLINRPKLDFSISKNSPHVKRIGLTQNQAGNESDSYIEIMVQVANDGRTVVQNLRAYIAELYATNEAGGLCRVASFAHESFDWHSGDNDKTKVDVHPQTSRFLCVGKIAESSLLQQSPNNTPINSSQSLGSDLFVLLKDGFQGGEPFRVEQKMIVIPLLFVSDQHRIKVIKYLQIAWTKKSIRDFGSWSEADFSLEFINEHKFKKMLPGGK
jgi:hypothetical protein